MSNLIERMLDYFLPSHLLEHSDIDSFLYGRINVGAFLSLAILIPPVFIINTIIYPGPYYRSVAGLVVILLSFTSLFVYRYLGPGLLNRLNLVSVVQVVILMLVVGFIVLESETFANSALFWMVLILITMSYYSGVRGTLLTAALAFLVMTITFLLLEVNILNFKEVGTQGHDYGHVRFFLTDLTAILIYTIFLSFNYRNSKKHIDNLLRAQRAEMEMQRQRLSESVKTSALAKMATSLAHEINNPIFSTQGEVHAFREMIERGDVDLDKSLAMIDGIERKLLGISKIVRGVSAFARQRKLEQREIVPLEQLFDEALTFCFSRIQDEGVQFYQSFEKKYFINCHPMPLTQVIINLLVNALDSMINCEKKEIEVRARSYGKVVEILFFDTGEGVTPEVESKIFEPFFTTKDPYSGTGLGLSISRSIAKEHGGSLFFDRRFDRTCFVLILPLFEKITDGADQ